MPSFRERFKQKEKTLSNQQRQQFKSASEGTSFPSIIIKSKLPAGVEIIKIKEGTHTFDIIPFFAGENFPLDPETMRPNVEKGDMAYVIDIEIHQNVGPNKIPFVCPNRNFGLPCPMCEFIAAHSLEKDDWQKVAPKRRSIYLVWWHDTVETERKGIQILDMSWHQMEKELAEIAALPKGGGSIQFAHPYDGKNILFKRTGTGMKNTSFHGYRFADRDMQIPEKLLDLAFPLDECIKMHPTYEEIEKVFQGQMRSLGAGGESNGDAGSNFAGGEEGGGTGDDVPDWMRGDDPEPKKETSVSPKRKLVFRRK